NTWRHGGTVKAKRQKMQTQYHVGYMRRYLGEPYPVIVDHIEALAGQFGDPDIVIDATGVGRPVVDMVLERGLNNIAAISITGGDAVNSDGHEHRVPKRDLV